ncbi:MAG: hypothetical protein C0597_00715, partial [Marinilabiliales bacterium]
MISLNLYSQQVENLKLSEKNKIIEEVTKITDDMSFIRGSDKWIVQCNFSFGSDLNTQNNPWCNTYLEALKSINDSKESTIYSYIAWDYKKISPMDLKHVSFSVFFIIKCLKIRAVYIVE